MADEATTTETTSEEHEAPTSKVEDSKTEEKSSGKTYDEAYVKDLRRESAGYRTERNDLKAQLDAANAKIEELTSGTESTSARATDLERENARLKVALDTGLPKELIPRLVGNTEEELKADAEQLLAIVGTSSAGERKVGFDGGSRKGVEAPDLATKISEAEQAGDVKLAIRLKAQMAMESRENDGTRPTPLTKS